MNKKWALIWCFWFVLIAVSFAILEAFAWKGGSTLSRTTWDISTRFPLIIYLWGNLTGGLAVHFFWHWNPPGSISEG